MTYPYFGDDNELRRFPCPSCGQKVHNSEEAFQQHWEDYERCSGLEDHELKLVKSKVSSKLSNTTKEGTASSGGSPSSSHSDEKNEQEMHDDNSNMASQPPVRDMEKTEDDTVEKDNSHQNDKPSESKGKKKEEEANENYENSSPRNKHTSKKPDEDTGESTSRDESDILSGAFENGIIKREKWEIIKTGKRSKLASDGYHSGNKKYYKLWHYLPLNECPRCGEYQLRLYKKKKYKKRTLRTPKEIKNFVGIHCLYCEIDINSIE